MKRMAALVWAVLLAATLMAGCNQAAREEQAEQMVQAGRQAAQSGDHVSAQEAYQKAVEANPESYEAYHALGKSLAAQGKHQEAEAAFRKAIALRSDYLSPRLALADLLAQQGQVQEAAAVLEEAAAVKPVAAVLIPLGRYYEQLGEIEKARTAYEQVLATDPEHRVAQSRLEALAGS